MNHRFHRHRRLDLGPLQSHRSTPDLRTEAIFDSNIDAATPGSVRIALWHEWQPLLNELGDVGPVWSIVRNPHCTLAVQGPYPKLTFASDLQTAMARRNDNSLACHFRAWRRAVAFDSACCCGKLYGVEIENRQGQVFHRVCLAKGTLLQPFIEWTQMHQATGLEEDDDALPIDQGRFHPQSFRRLPGTLEVPLHRLRTVLIHAAQREIPLTAAVASEGITQTARLDVLRAGEAQGQLVLSGNHRSLYVDTEPAGSLLVEPTALEGEPIWRLSLVDPDNHRLLHLQPGLDGRPAWNQLIREFVLRPSTSEP
jgi:hypothetical protein